VPSAGVQLPLAEALGVTPDRLPPVHRVEHHPAHLASAFYVSPHERAAVCSADGFGDFVSATAARGRGTVLDVFFRVPFPHSLGLFYTAVTQYLGFVRHGDEYKVMGLSAHGEPRFVDALDRLVFVRPEGDFRLDLSYFQSWPDWYRAAASRRGDPEAPRVRRLFSPKLAELLGPPREPDGPVDERHADIACSLQHVFERAMLELLRAVARGAECRVLCVAGGCFMNSALNGKIREATPFDELFVQPAAGDNGLSLGAAYAVWCDVLGRPRSYVMGHAYLGPSYTEAEVEAAIGSLPPNGLDVVRYPDRDELCRATARLIADGHVVGWFQGRMEWGSRALGNRSILADPRRADMRDRINEKVKRREPFRPFAPTVLGRAVDDFFAGGVRDPFMMHVVRVREDKRALIPAVVHVDGTSRPQAVAADTNPLFHRLIEEFEGLTGIPMVLNTSLNENEPIVDTPTQALECFRRTTMDALVLEHALVRRS
jgi:carbamoyltransferase